MNKEKFRLSILFIVFLFLCSYPLFLNLGKLSIRMWDEARNAINALESIHDHHFIVTYFEGQPDMWNTKPPLFIWMAALSMKIFGPTVFALRLPSALSALAIAIYCFWFSKKYLGHILPGFFSGLVLATSIGFVDYHVARNGDFDAMLSMWIFFYSTQFFLYLEFQQRKNLTLAALFLALAILTKGIAGCLVLPGLFLFVFTSKQYRNVLKKKEFYFLSVAGLLLGLSYYFIREGFNPGYIKAVIENEITGRYLETNEGHTGDAFYYLRLLNENHFSAWLYWVPASFIIILFKSEGLFKKFGIFLFIQCIGYLIITTVSHTKLPWYDAPLYPFMALLIGLGLTQIYMSLNKLSFMQSAISKTILFVVLTAGAFASPIQDILHTSIRAQKETYYPQLFYGDFINSFYATFPQQKVLNVMSEDYNPHLLFYQKLHEYKGHKINIINPRTPINKNDTLMVCENMMWPQADSAYVFDTLYQEDNNKFILTIADPHQLNSIAQKGEKRFLRSVSEIKNNPEWLSLIKEKAEKNKVDLNKQIMFDALWELKNKKIITPELEDSLKAKYHLTL